MLHSALRRLQIRASHASEKELRRAALWSAALVLGIVAITVIPFYFVVHNKASDPPVAFDIYVYVVSLPLFPGEIVGGGIRALIEFLSGSHGPIVNWIDDGISYALNWYLYFVLFAIWISRRNRAKQQSAAAQGTSPNVA